MAVGTLIFITTRALVRLTVERARGTRELCAITVPAEHLKAVRISICANPSPQPGTACAEIVFFPMCGTVPDNMV
jgi:hypothetical protein